MSQYAELLDALMQARTRDNESIERLRPAIRKAYNADTQRFDKGLTGMGEAIFDAIRRPKATAQADSALQEAMLAQQGYQDIAAQVEAMQRQREEEELAGLYQQVPGVSGPAEAQLRSRGMDIPKQEDSRTTLIKNAEAMGLKPGTPEFNDYVRQASVRAGVTVNTGDQGPQVGTIPPGFELRKDEETGAYSMQPIPGGPADIEQQESERIGEQKSMNARAKYSGVLDEVEQAMGKVNNLTAGFIGSGASRIPGTEAYTLSRHLDTIKGNLGFDRLQQMREESKTGGALGQVSNIELNLLTSSLTALDPGLPPEQLKRNLEKVENHYTNFLDALSGKMPKGYDEQGNPVEAAQSGVPQPPPGFELD